MHFLRSLLVGVSLAAVTLAQGVAFTAVPDTVTAGIPFTLTWTGPSAPATIILRQGLSTNLNTISTLTSTATGGSATLTLDTSLPSGSDYAFEIRIGSDVNFSGLITLAGGSASASISASASASSVSASISSVAASISASVSSVLSSLNATITTSATASVGTGSPISRNSTLSIATLTGSTASRTSGATTTGSGSTSSATSAPNSAAGLSSPLALVLGAFAAIVYLN